MLQPHSDSGKEKLNRKKAGPRLREGRASAVRGGAQARRSTVVLIQNHHLTFEIIWCVQQVRVVYNVHAHLAFVNRTHTRKWHKPKNPAARSHSQQQPQHACSFMMDANSRSRRALMIMCASHWPWAPHYILSSALTNSQCWKTAT